MRRGGFGRKYFQTWSGRVYPLVNFGDRELEHGSFAGCSAISGMIFLSFG
jgi:hypothetical protein